MTEALQPGADQAEAFEELIEELDPAPEGQALRKPLDLPASGSRQEGSGGTGAAARTKAERQPAVRRQPRICPLSTKLGRPGRDGVRLALEPRSFDEDRVVDVSDPERVEALAAELRVRPDEVREAVDKVGENRKAVEIWLGRAEL